VPNQGMSKSAVQNCGIHACRDNVFTLRGREYLLLHQCLMLVDKPDQPYKRTNIPNYDLKDCAYFGYLLFFIYVIL
jgi:hypothetical protein